MHLKGTLPLLLLHLLRGGPLHGYALAQRIHQQSEGVLDFKEGTLYPLLHSLEALNAARPGSWQRTFVRITSVRKKPG